MRDLVSKNGAHINWTQESLPLFCRLWSGSQEVDDASNPRFVSHEFCKA